MRRLSVDAHLFYGSHLITRPVPDWSAISGLARSESPPPTRRSRRRCLRCRNRARLPPETASRTEPSQHASHGTRWHPSNPPNNQIIAHSSSTGRAHLSSGSAGTRSTCRRPAPRSSGHQPQSRLPAHRVQSARHHQGSWQAGRQAHRPRCVRVVARAPRRVRHQRALHHTRARAHSVGGVLGRRGREEGGRQRDAAARACDEGTSTHPAFVSGHASDGDRATERRVQRRARDRGALPHAQLRRPPRTGGTTRQLRWRARVREQAGQR